MKLLDKLRERINNSRVSGVVMTEDFVMSPIPFRTRHGGADQVILLKQGI